MIKKKTFIDFTYIDFWFSDKSFLFFLSTFLRSGLLVEQNITDNVF